MKLFNDGWQFAKAKPEGFKPINIPHDWLIYDTKNLYKSEIGWYKRELDAEFLKEGQRIIIRFDGVYMDSTLFVNGEFVGEWKYGYTAFEHDITDYVRKDSINTLLLKVNYMSQSSRWYTGAGIYRDVYIIVKNECRFISDGIYITTEKKDGEWRYKADAEVHTDGKPYEVKHTLLDAENGIEEWDIENPKLYTLKSELIVEGTIEDTVFTEFGFRTIEFTPDRGFFLNGRHVSLKGVCLHHDLGALGAAVYPDAIRRQLKTLREMGVNAIRTAHNPPAKIFMEIADEMGLLVISEILDVWKIPKTKNDYSNFFDKWVRKDVESWIKRDRNHPSIIMWSVGNEIADTHLDSEKGTKTLKTLMAFVKEFDPNGHAPATFASNYMPWENTQTCADNIKLIGYNYGENLYEEHHEKHLDWIIYGAETCATVQSRGVYHFPLKKSILADDDLQCSALGNSSTSWGARSIEECLKPQAEHSLGQFLWSGQDYIGEPTPYHTKNSYFGHVDTAGFPKDSYYMFQAAWTDYEQNPMIHLFPYWDFSPGQIVDVRVCSNAPEVELFLNGKSLGGVKLKDKFVADWQVPYFAGEIKAVAKDENGDIVAKACRKSFGEAYKLLTETETFGELDFVTVYAVDENGNHVENANRRVNIEVEVGKLLGTDNGDSTDYDQYKSSSRRMFGGKLLAVIKREGKGNPDVAVSFDEKDIPIRKIELTVNGYDIIAKILPRNATYDDFSWRMTDASGVDSILGSLHVAEDGKSAQIVPKGDGEVYIRCQARNGGNHPAFISQISTQITGVGKPFIDPYSFVSASLYTKSNVELTNGNERGIATLRKGESHVCFCDLDFGNYGSDEVTLPIFALDGNPFVFEIWGKMPGEGGGKLCDVLYDKGSEWNVYKDIVCKLPKRLKGVCELCLVFKQKVHIKGFCFKKYDKAFEKLSASENDGISGDSYVVCKESVEGIGNNVSITYENMDFGNDGASGIEVCWRSGIEKNSIQLAFDEDGKRILKTIMVARAKEYLSHFFEFDEKVYGNKKLTFIFLPGCNLDFAWFRFLK